VDSFGSEQGPVEMSLEHGIEPSSFIKVIKLLNTLWSKIQPHGFAISKSFFVLHLPFQSTSLDSAPFI